MRSMAEESDPGFQRRKQDAGKAHLAVYHHLLLSLKLLANSLYEIHYHQKMTGTILPRSPFQRLIHAICHNDVLAKEMCFSTEALAAFQTATEHYICMYFKLLYIFISVFAN